MEKCVVCGGKLLPGTQAAEVITGVVGPKGTLVGSSSWGKMHGDCVTEILGRPKDVLELLRNRVEAVKARDLALAQEAEKLEVPGAPAGA